MKIENKHEKLLWFALILSFISFSQTMGMFLNTIMGYLWLVFAIIELRELKKEGVKHGRKVGK